MRSGWHADCPVRRALLAHGREGHLGIHERTCGCDACLCGEGSARLAQVGEHGKDAAVGAGAVLKLSFWKICLTWASTVRSVMNARPLARQCAARSRSGSGMPLREEHANSTNVRPVRWLTIEAT
jgi:hypothetical protein